jgi:hypothetical protein
LINGRASVNIIIKNLETKLGVPKPISTPYNFIMVYHSLTRPLGIITNLKIHIHSIPNISTFIILKNNVVDSNYFILLGRPWLRDANITYDLGNNVIIVQGNGIVITI